jgi:Amidohydrolase
VLVQTVPVAEETPEMLTAADSADKIAGVVGWAHLRAPDVADRLAALAEGAGGRWLAGWREHVTGLAHRQNVAVKLSGLLTEAGPGADATAPRPYRDHLLGAFGPDRTMLGSDWHTRASQPCG